MRQWIGQLPCVLRKRDWINDRRKQHREKAARIACKKASVAVKSIKEKKPCNQPVNVARNCEPHVTQFQPSNDSIWQKPVRMRSHRGKQIDYVLLQFLLPAFIGRVIEQAHLVNV